MSQLQYTRKVEKMYHGRFKGSQYEYNVIKLRAILMKIIKTNIEAVLKLILSRLVFTLRSIYLDFSA